MQCNGLAACHIMLQKKRALTYAGYTFAVKYASRQNNLFTLKEGSCHE